MIYLGKFIIIISKSKLKDKKPSRLYHDFHSIKWLNNRKKQDMVRSINNLIQYNDANDNHSLSTFNLSVANSPQEINDDQNNNKLLINPKYLFTEKYNAKIKKIKELFVEFDTDHSCKILFQISKNGF